MARRDGDSYVLDGEKRWIGNATFADLTVVWARDAETNEVGGFLVEKGAPGFEARVIEGKTSQRPTIGGGLMSSKMVDWPGPQALPTIRRIVSSPTVISRRNRLVGVSQRR